MKMCFRAGWICNASGLTTATNIEHAESRDRRRQKRYPQNPGRKYADTSSSMATNVLNQLPQQNRSAAAAERSGCTVFEAITIHRDFKPRKPRHRGGRDALPPLPDAPVAWKETQYANDQRRRRSVAGLIVSDHELMTLSSPVRYASPARHKLPATASAPADPPLLELKSARYLFPAVGSGACSQVQPRRRQYRGRALAENNGSADEEATRRSACWRSATGNGT